MTDSPARIPDPALVLGVLGVLPFAALTAARGMGLDLASIPTVPALETYGAIILSFMGGAQWGLAVAASGDGRRGLWRRFGISVLPALVAWANFLSPPATALGGLAAAFALLAAYDCWSVLRGEAPAWYGRLRVGLSIAVVVCMVVAELAGPQP